MKKARSIADVTVGTILATVDLAVSPERTFRAITEADELVRWWGAADHYETTSWRADLRAGGTWRSEGRTAGGDTFSVEGEYLEVDPPRRLVHTWRSSWDDGAPTTVTWSLEPIPTGTRLTVRHEGFGERADSCRGHGAGWELVLGWLRGHLAGPEKFYLCRLIGPRPTFAFDMTDAEREVMAAHAGYWQERLAMGDAIVFGPVADPAGPWGLGVIRAADEQQLAAFQADDPAIRSGLGFHYEVLPMLQAVS